MSLEYAFPHTAQVAGESVQGATLEASARMPTVRRRPIAQLPPDLVNRIAAGEVIERPASVVKELVENALDAGAERITVEIEEGGRSLVRVIDDGAGIPPQELPLAFAQHATSKLRDDAELTAIATMGFRGEALASIGSVSRARVLSRCGEAGAFEISNEGGHIGDVKAAAGNAGTTVEVRDLFFNTPARRKFLKSPAAESGQVTDMLVRLALPRPRSHFRYLRDGKLVGDWAASEDSLERFLVAWPAEYVEAFRARPMIIDVVDEREASLWRLHGVVGLPEFAATGARYQHFYVNGRAVRDKSASHAMREAFRGLTEPGRHPAAILQLELPPDEVDVNVHPTKAEVRFRSASRLWSLVHSALREALLGHDLAPIARPQSQPPVWSIPREDVRQSLASFFKDALGEAQQRLELGKASQDETQPAHEVGMSWIEVADRPIGATHSGQAKETLLSDRPPLSEDWSNGPSNTAAPSHFEATPSAPAAAFEGEGPPARAIQVHNSYLVVQSDEGMEIIDQHALHERIIYEELLSRLSRGPLESQRLLLPLTFDAPEAHVVLLEELAVGLARLGVEAEAFGPTAVAVHSFPSFLSRLDPAQFLRDALAKAEADLLGATGQEAWIHEVLDMMACRAAVKAGDPLTPAEIAALIQRRGLVERSSNCPHGRPTTLRLSLSDLEKQFKRTGF